MDYKEKIEKANIIRSRDRFGELTKEELSQLPGIQTEKYIKIGEQDIHYYELRPNGEIADKVPLIINFHGGGFIKGRSNRDRRYCSFLVNELNCIVWDIDYSLAPENPFPYGLRESYSIVEYAFRYADSLGIDKERISLSGHSSGGNFVAGVMLMLAEKKEFKPCCILMEYFPTDQTIPPIKKLSAEMANDEWWVKRVKTEQEYICFYCTEDQLTNPLCSPILAEEKLFSEFPDTLIISAGIDTLRNETEQFAKKLVESGVTVLQKRFKEAIHGFTTNRTEGWEEALLLHKSFFEQHFYK